MNTALTLHLVLPIPGGTITVDTEDPAALADRLVADVLARVTGLDRIDHPAAADPVRVTDLASQDRAKAICARCPHTAACLDEALSLPVSQDQGVRAGYTDRQRRRMPRRRTTT